MSGAGTALALLLAAQPAGAREAQPAGAGAPGPAFTVKIDNRCPRVLSARFVLLPLDAPSSLWEEAMARAPAEPLDALTVVTRRMRPGEKMMIVDGRHSFGAWFDTAKEGRGGVIEIHENCDGVTVLNGPTHRRRREKRRD